jgi:hypothetical protein
VRTPLFARRSTRCWQKVTRAPPDGVAAADPAATPFALTPGDRLGSFEIVALIDGGGQGSLQGTRHARQSHRRDQNPS